MYHWPDGSVYKGNWVDFQMDGSGEFIWPDKSKYIGGYKNGAKHGPGVFIDKEGRRFDGNWVDGEERSLKNSIRQSEINGSEFRSKMNEFSMHKESIKNI